MKSKKGTKKLTILLAVITVVAGLFFIAGLNKTHPSPFSTHTQRTFVYVIAEEGNSGVVVDPDARQLLFTDPEGHITHIEDVGKSGSPINRIYNGCMSNGQIKIHGGMAIRNGVCLSSESVVAYSMQGAMISEDLRQEYAEEERVTSPQFNLAEIYAEESAVFGELTYEVTLEYSVWYFVGIVAYWLSVVWIAVLALALIVWLFVKKLKRKGLYIAVAILAILATATFYTYNLGKQLEDRYADTVVVLTKSITSTLQEKLEAANELIENDSDANAATPVEKALIDEEVVRQIEQLNSAISMLCNSPEADFVPMVNLVFYDGESALYSLIDSTQQVPIGTKVTLSQDAVNRLLDHDVNAVADMGSANGKLMCDIDTFKARLLSGKNDNAQVIVRVAYYRDSLTANMLETSVDLFVSLLAAFIAIYVLVELLIVYRREFRHRDEGESKLDRTARMSGVYTFVYKMADKIDGAVMVYVALSMCASDDPVTQAIFAAIPMAAWSVGRWVGAFLATPLIRRFGERAMGFAACVAGIVTMLFMAYSVIGSNIFLYSLGKGFWGLFMGGIMYVLSDNMPLSATTDKGKTLAIDSVQQSTMAAYIISVLIGGYISEFISYSTIYAVGAAISVAMLVLTVYVFGKKTPNLAVDDVTQDARSIREYWRVFLKSEMMMYCLFYMVPCMLIGGYGSYLFPLYSDNAGISALLLSNINVIATAFVYALGKPISEFASRIDKRTILVLPNLAICVGLVCFIISPNIYWAIFMLFAYLALDRMTRVGSKMYVVDVARKYELNEKTLASNSITVNTAIFAFQSPALSAFVGLGMSLACAAVGGFSAVMLCVFGVYVGKQWRRGSNENVSSALLASGASVGEVPAGEAPVGAAVATIDE